MKSSFFDLRDLAGVARASIPWTPVIIIPAERHNLMRRTNTVREPDLYVEYMSAVQVARAARAVYFAEAMGNAARAVRNWFRSLRGLEPTDAVEAPSR